MLRIEESLQRFRRRTVSGARQLAHSGRNGNRRVTLMGLPSSAAHLIFAEISADVASFCDRSLCYLGP